MFIKSILTVTLGLLVSSMSVNAMTLVHKYSGGSSTYEDIRVPEGSKACNDRACIFYYPANNSMVVLPIGGQTIKVEILP